MSSLLWSRLQIPAHSQHNHAVIDTSEYILPAKLILWHAWFTMDETTDGDVPIPTLMVTLGKIAKDKLNL